MASQQPVSQGPALDRQLGADPTKASRCSQQVVLVGQRGQERIYRRHDLRCIAGGRQRQKGVWCRCYGYDFSHDTSDLVVENGQRPAGPSVCEDPKRLTRSR